MTIRPGQSHWTWRYFRDRELAAGRRWWVHRDPEVAAEEIASYLGGVRLAQRWAAELLQALERQAP